jgi:4'-phosphopantetheinyl transferase
MNSANNRHSPNSWPELVEDKVLVWSASLALNSATLEKFASTLSGEERARAERFVFERDRNSFTAAHGILRDVLGRYLGCGPRVVNYVYGLYGKPAVSSLGSHCSLRFNLSHSHGIAVIAIANGREIGVDVEKIRPELASLEIASRYFSVEEVEELRALPANLRVEGFFLCWTRKEAYVKALGEGLRFPLDSFRVSLSPGQPAELHDKNGSSWRIESFIPGVLNARHVAAVVSEGTEWTAEYFQWKQEGD